MYLETTNVKENFEIELMSGNFEHNPPEAEDFYYVSISKPLSKEEIEALIRGEIDEGKIKIETAIFYDVNKAKDVYMTFINESFNEMHTFEQKALLLKELEKYHNQIKFKIKN